MGRSIKYPKLPHNRLLLSLAHGFGHRLDRFGNPDFCGDGPLPNLIYPDLQASVAHRLRRSQHTECWSAVPLVLDASHQQCAIEFDRS